MAKTEYPAPVAPPRQKKPNPLFFPPTAPRSRNAKMGYYARRVMFVLVGTCFVLSLAFSIFQALVAQIEPELTPAVPSTSLENNPLVPENEDGIYIQKSDMSLLEMPNLTEPVQIDPSEVIHLKSSELDSLVLRPKVMDNLADYKVYKLNPQTQYGDIRYKIVPGTNAVHIYPGPNGWETGDYMLEIPIPAGMFGGQYYTYFTIVP